MSLDVSGFHLLLWACYYTTGVLDDWQDVSDDDLNFALTIQLGLQDLPYFVLFILCAHLVITKWYTVLSALYLQNSML